MALQICGHVVDDPMPIWRNYAKDYARTIRTYDLADPGESGILTADEAWRSRRINSRLTRTECDEVVGRALQVSWSDVPADADLADADPTIPDGLFAKAADLYWAFMWPERIKGVGRAKAHKVLHIKRPGLYPILDRRIRSAYQQYAATWTERLGHLKGVTDTDSPPYWAAFRDDLIRNSTALEQGQVKLAQDADEDVRSMARLTTVRLQDIIAWSVVR